jgi:hypothetical protein
MRRALIRSGRLGAAALASAALALSLPSAAVAAHLPLALTGKVQRAHGVTALLTGGVNPEGSPTTYFFQYGPTAAYGLHTASASAGSGTAVIKVGLAATQFSVGFHFRLVASNAAGTSFGRDRVYSPKTTKLKIELPRNETVPLGTSVVVSGRMTGIGAGNHKIALLASPYPYKEAFERIGLPTVTSPSGRFSFRVGVLTASTQFKVMTLDPLPRFSKTLSEHVSVRVTIKVRTSGKLGLVRIYGTVAPVEVGARVEFQLQRSIRPGLREKNEERTTRFQTQGTTVVKRATRHVSRFSGIVNIRHTGRYRVLIVIRAGPLVSGASRTLLIHGPPGRAKH